MNLFFDTGLPTMIALGAVALVVGMMLLRVQRHYGRHPSSNSPASPSPAPRHPSPAPRAPAARELGEWEVHMHDFAREMSGQLDSKMAALEHLIREANRAAARLESALAAARRQEPPAPAQTVPAETFLRPTSQADALKPAASVAGGGERTKDEGLGIDTDFRPNTPSLIPHPSSLSSADRPSRQRRHEEVYTLADYGYSAPEIAQQTGTPVGEIELILSLREKR
jgi:hypothetical protein